MTINLSDFYDGTITGQATLKPKKAEIAVTQKGAPYVNVLFVIIEAEPQGEGQVDVAGETIFHKILFPSTDNKDGGKFLGQMLKATVRALFGADAAMGEISEETLADSINQNADDIIVNVILKEDSYNGQTKTVIDKFLS